MTETSTSTILSDWLSEKINPYHLKAWLSLHFGKGRYNISGRFLEGVFNVDGTPNKVYEIRAPREIREFEVFPLWEFEMRDERKACEEWKAAAELGQQSEGSTFKHLATILESCESSPADEVCYKDAS